MRFLGNIMHVGKWNMVLEHVMELEDSILHKLCLVKHRAAVLINPQDCCAVNTEFKSRA